MDTAEIVPVPYLRQGRRRHISKVPQPVSRNIYESIIGTILYQYAPPAPATSTVTLLMLHLTLRDACRVSPW